MDVPRKEMPVLIKARWQQQANEDQQVRALSEAYKELCRQSVINEAPHHAAHKCFIEFSHLSVAFMEVASSQPLLVVFHRILSERTMREAMEVAEALLEEPKTVHAQTGKVTANATTRSGKVAFLAANQGGGGQSVMMLPV